jgi:hypothetical protein
MVEARMAMTTLVKARTMVKARVEAATMPRVRVSNTVRRTRAVVITMEAMAWVVATTMVKVTATITTEKEE